MQKEEALNSDGHARETLGWVAIEQGVSQLDELTFEAGSVVLPKQGFRTKMGTDLSFNDSLGANAFAMAKMASLHGGDTAWVRGTTAAVGADLGVWIDEDTSLDAERAHLGEIIDYIAFSDADLVLGSAYDELLF